MGKIIESKTENIWDEGMTGNLRGSYGCAFSGHFESFSDRLIPQRALTDQSTVEAAYRVVNVDDSGTDRLYCLTGTAATAIHRGQGGSGYPYTGFGTTYASAQNPKTDAFFYANRGFIYFMDEGNDLCHFEVATNTITDNFVTGFTPNTIGRSYTEPVAHPGAQGTTSDYVYFFGAANVYLMDGVPGAGTFSTKLSTSSAYNITAACAYKDYLAIGQSPLEPGEHIMVGLWDMDENNTRFSEKIDFGEGILMGLATLDGVLTAVIKKNNNNYSGDTELVIRQYVGGGESREVKQSGLPSFQFANNGNFWNDGYKLYFTGGRLGDAVYSTKTFDSEEDGKGIYSVDAQGRVRNEITSTAPTATTAIHGFMYSKGYYWLMYDSAIVRSVDDGLGSATAFAGTSIYETKIMKLGSAWESKKLVSIAVAHELLDSSANNVTIKYRFVGETDWTTCITNSTEGTTITNAVRTSTGDTLGQGREVQIRIESVGGVIITGLRVKAELLDDTKN